MPSKIDHTHCGCKKNGHPLIFVSKQDNAFQKLKMSTLLNVITITHFPELFKNLKKNQQNIIK